MTHGSVSYRINNVPPPFAGALACVAAKKKTPSRGGLHKENWTVVIVVIRAARIAPTQLFVKTAIPMPIISSNKAC